MMKVGAGVLAIAVHLGVAGMLLAGNLYTLDPAIRPRHQPVPGTAHLAGGATKVVLPADVLTRSYLFWSVVEASTENILNLGTSTRPILVKFSLHDGVLDMVQDTSAIYPDSPGAPLSIVNRFPARSVSGGVEIDLAGAARVGLGSSSLTSTAASEVSGFKADAAGITWAQVLLMQSDSATVDNPGPLTIAFRYWLRPVSDTGYVAREYPDQDQDKVGFFRTAVKTRDAAGLTQVSTVANRWDPRGQVTVVIHPTVPAPMRPAVKQAVLCWNSAFRKVLHRDFVKVEEGTDPSVLPGTPGKIVIYWYDYDVPNTTGILAIGPSLADPRTGELFSGYVLFYGARVRRLIGVFKSDAKFLASDMPPESPASPPPGHAFRLMLPGGGALDFAQADGYPVDPLAALDARAASDASSMSDDQIMARLTTEMLPHEVGHTLGLRHNFKGTADLAHLRPGESATTVMDYPVYLSALTGPGPYDELAIGYGYGGASADTMQGYLYGTDDVKDIDPDANTFDAGDPLVFYTARIGYYRKLLASPETFPKPEDYAAAFEATLTHLRRFVNVAAPERSSKAFALLCSIAQGAGQAPAPRAGALPLATLASTYGFIERIVAMSILAAHAPAQKGATPFAPLTHDQVGAVAQVCGDALAGIGGASPMAVRQAALKALVALKDIRAFQVLEAIDKVSSVDATQPATSDADLAFRTLAIAIHKAVQEYF